MFDVTEIIADSGSVRLDVFIAEKLGATRSNARNMIDSGLVMVNGAVPKKSGIALKNGDVIEIAPITPKELSLDAEDVDFEIVYEDESLAVVNKPQGLVVHPCETAPKGTLVNGLMGRLSSLSGINGVLRPGIVHRLDKNTAGLLVVAKSDAAHISLQEQIKNKSARRSYVALVDGVPKKKEGDIIANIDRSKKDRKIMAVAENGGRYAETHYKVVAEYGSAALVAYELKTGRTHQIRVHSKLIGHPIVGDEVYGGSTKLYDKGQLLFAYRLAFRHPVTNKEMVFFADLPDYFYRVLLKLDKNLQSTVDILYGKPINATSYGKV